VRSGVMLEQKVHLDIGSVRARTLPVARLCRSEASTAKPLNQRRPGDHGPIETSATPPRARRWCGCMDERGRLAGKLQRPARLLGSDSA